MTSAKTITARCHCGTFSATFDIPSSSFPLKSSLCHCTDCRYSTGMLYATFAVIPLPPLARFPAIPHPSFAPLVAYHSSSSLTRYLCPKCGASVGTAEPKEWEIATGLIDKVDGSGEIDGLLNRSQLFVGSTGDGGAAAWLPRESYNRYTGHRESKEVSDQDLAQMTESKKARRILVDDKLRARCHCGSIDFYIARSGSSRGGRNSDTVQGHTSLTETDDSNQAKQVDEQKLKTWLCACPSCRLTSGFEHVPWTFVLPEQVFWADGRQLEPDDPIFGRYSSSPCVHRGFCKSCGANIFRRSDDGDPHRYAVCSGLFRGDSARQEAWLSWFWGLKDGDTVWFPKDVELAMRVSDGFDRWKAQQ